MMMMMGDESERETKDLLSVQTKVFKGKQCFFHRLGWGNNGKASIAGRLTDKEDTKAGWSACNRRKRGGRIIDKRRKTYSPECTGRHLVKGMKKGA